MTVEDRRAKVATLRGFRRRSDEIAATLGVPLRTIQRDMAAIDGRAPPSRKRVIAERRTVVAALMSDAPWLSIDELARRIGVSVGTVRQDILAVCAAPVAGDVVDRVRAILPPTARIPSRRTVLMVADALRRNRMSDALRTMRYPTLQHNRVSRPLSADMIAADIGRSAHVVRVTLRGLRAAGEIGRLSSQYGGRRSGVITWSADVEALFTKEKSDG